jgi:hypothetical protein
VNGNFEEYNWTKPAIEAARLAPSAANRQPWKLEIGESSIMVSADNRRLDFGVSRRLDCGIAMLHIELGALSAGVRGKWELLEHPSVAIYRVN